MAQEEIIKILTADLVITKTFKMVAQNLHENGIKVVLDGVLNHVGRGFWALTKTVIAEKVGFTI